MSKTVTYLLPAPVDLKRAIAAEAAERGSNMNDVIVSLLAERHKVPFELTGRPSSTTPSDSPDIVLRMPKRLRSRIKLAAVHAETSMRDLIIAILWESFGNGVASDEREPQAAASA